MKIKVHVALFILLFLKQMDTWSITDPPDHYSDPSCKEAVTSQTDPHTSLQSLDLFLKRTGSARGTFRVSILETFNHYITLILNFSNELLPNLKDPLQEALFRFYVQFYFGREERQSVQKYVTRAIQAYEIYEHLLPYKKHFRRFQIKTSSGALWTVRPLSFVEAPLRGCLGYGCSSSASLDIAFHPNYHYFTLTDSEGISKGQITIVLGNALYTPMESTSDIHVAFVDKVENVTNEELLLMLEAIRQSVIEYGYVLALPRDMESHTDISVSKKTYRFIKNHVWRNTQHPLFDFSPHPHPASLINIPEDVGFSSATHGQVLFAIRPLTWASNVINRGAIVQSWPLQASLDSNDFFDLFFLLAKKGNQQTRVALAELLLHLPESMKSTPLFQRLFFAVLKRLAPQKMMKAFHTAMLNEDVRSMSWMVHNFNFELETFTSLWEPPIHLALNIGQGLQQKKLISYLVHLGADINALDSNGKPPLHHAVEKSDATQVTLLLDLEADVNAQNSNDGDTALHLGINNAEIRDILLSRGADRNITNALGQLPFDLLEVENEDSIQ